MNGILRGMLDVVRVDVGALRTLIAGMIDAKKLPVVRELVAFLEREENGHLVLSLFTRPGLHERNTPEHLRGAIADVDRAARTLCCSAVFRDPKHAAIRTYAGKYGYTSAASLIAAYAAPPTKKAKKMKT